jgi:flagellar assembly protein FliH
MHNKQDGRIPADQAADFSRWAVPRIDAKGNILASFEKEQRARKGQAGESVETVEKPPKKPQTLTAAMLEQIRAEASREGYQAGLQQGLLDGRQRGHDDAWSQTSAEISVLRENLQQLCQRLLYPLQNEQQQIVALLQEQVEQIARAVIAQELQTDSRIIATLLDEALEALPTGAQHIRIALNPADAECVNAYLQKNGLAARVLEDERIQAGGCRIDSEHSKVDYAVETRLQALLQQSMKESMKESIQQQAHSEGEAAGEAHSQDEANCDGPAHAEF